MTLTSDVAELLLLIRFLLSQGFSNIILLGHSTGCQVICRLFQLHNKETTPELSAVVGTILQGPVSDREYMATLPHTAENIFLASSMVAKGEGHALLPRTSHEDTPITATRFLSLAAPGGEDDMFSSDLTDEQLTSLIGRVTVPTLVVFSGADEYVPSSVDKKQLLARLTAALPRGSSVIIEDAMHSLAGYESELMAAVEQFIHKL